MESSGTRMPSLSTRSRSYMSKKSASSKFTISFISEEVSSSNPNDDLVEVEKPKINYQEETINIFYQSMLDLVVDSWDPYEETPEELPYDDEAGAEKESKDFTNLTDMDIRSSQIVSVEGSQVSFLKKKGNKSKSSVGILKNSVNDISTSNREQSVNGLPSEGKSEKGTSPVTSEQEMLVKEELYKTLSKELEAQIYDVSSEYPFDEELSIIYFKSGAIYKGPTYKKCMHGYGQYYWPDGSYYKGEFKNGEITGKGFLILPDLSVCFGDFCCGWFHGKGTMHVAGTSMIYSGSWKGGKKDGKGWLLYKQGNWYDGEWKDDRKHGYGLRQYDYGIRYKGMWKHGKKHGEGSMLYKNNDYYQGDWLDDLPHGEGEYTWNVVDNDTFCFPLLNNYKGTWRNGTRDGIGLMNFGLNSGATLAGVWRNNLKHGAGVLVCGNGKIVECNPLFHNDKPLHTDIDYKNTKNSLSLDSDNYKYSNTNFSLFDSDGSSRSNAQFIATLQFDAEDLPSDSALRDIMESKSDSNTKHQFVQMEYGDFQNPPVRCNPIDIPIHSVPQSLSLFHFQQMYVLTCKGNCETHNIFRKGSSFSMEPLEKKVLFGREPPYLCLCQFVDDKLFLMQHCNYTIRDFETELDYMRYEEEKMRTLLVSEFPNILRTYEYYAKLTVPEDKPVNFKPVMTRMFLWQLYRDIGLVDLGFSLVELDLFCSANPESVFNSEHDPFEEIYIWQFLQCLICVGLSTCSFCKAVDKIKGQGVLATVFGEFFTGLVLPNIGRRKEQFLSKAPGPNSGKCLFEYKDLLPMNSVYELYQQYGEPHTVRDFLKNSCFMKKEKLPCYRKSYIDEGLAIIKNGINVACFGRPIFLSEDEPLFHNRTQPPPPEDEFFKNLYVFRSLGPKRIIDCITSVCPPVKEEGTIRDMDYKLTFIEFYDIILACAYMMIERKMRKIAREKRREEIRLLMEQGLWVPPSKEPEKSKKNKDKKQKDKKKKGKK